MKKTSQRAQRVGDQIQRELADLFATEVKDPRVGRVTITAVEVAGDFAHAQVFFTHLAGKARTAGFLRSELARRIDLYSVPQLHFVYDDSIEAGMRLSSLIDQAVAEDKQHPKSE